MQALNLKSDQAMWDTWLSLCHHASLTVADEIGLFPLLENKKQNIKKIAKQLKINVARLDALVNVLIALKFLKKVKNNLHLTSTTKYFLLPNSPFYWGPLLHSLKATQQHKKLLTAIKQKKNLLIHKNLSFTTMWEKGNLPIDAAEKFTNIMHATIFAPISYAVKSGIFTSSKNILDIGGGAGSFSISFVNRYPNRKLTIFELPVVCKIAKRFLKKFEVEKKIQIIPGNFFQDEFPEKHDGILFSQIFHDWPIETCELLAKKAFDALPKGGKIYIHEMILDKSKTKPLTIALFNLLMLINHQSQQYTKSMVFEILKFAGFKNLKIKKTFGYFSVITGTK